MGPFGMSGAQTTVVMLVVLFVVLVITTGVITTIERIKIAKYTGRNPRVRQNENE